MTYSGARALPRSVVISIAAFLFLLLLLTSTSERVKEAVCQSDGDLNWGDLQIIELVTEQSTVPTAAIACPSPEQPETAPAKPYVHKAGDDYNILSYLDSHSAGLWVGPELVEHRRNLERQQHDLVHSQFRTHTPAVLSKRPTIAMVTFLIDRHSDDFHQAKVDWYTPYISFTISNFAKYAQRHGYPFLFLNDFIVPVNSSGFWGKLQIVLHHMNNLPDIEWFLYTDTDVLFINQDIPLDAFIEPCAESHHFVAVFEPVFNNPATVGKLVRSGFFMIRNTPEGRGFMQVWLDQHGPYRNTFNPEQTALEDLFMKPEHQPLFCVHPHMSMHTYFDFYRDGMFSVHFPSPDSKLNIPKWYQHYFGNKNEDFLWHTLTKHCDDAPH